MFTENTIKVIVIQESDLLDFDKPLSEQSQKVRDAIQSLGEVNNRSGQNMLEFNPLGEALYRAISSEPEFASMALQAIGIPGLGLYLAARALGVNTQVAAANLGQTWWAVPVLILSALQNGLLEEVLVVGYLLARLEQAGWTWRWAVAASALLRGAYHLYQGFGGFVGNVVMGVVFALVWRRTRRVGPLVLAHTLIDVAAFLGYAVLHGRVSWL